MTDDCLKIFRTHAFTDTRRSPAIVTFWAMQPLFPAGETCIIQQYGVIGNATHISPLIGTFPLREALARLAVLESDAQTRFARADDGSPFQFSNCFWDRAHHSEHPIARQRRQCMQNLDATSRSKRGLKLK